MELTRACTRYLGNAARGKRKGEGKKRGERRREAYGQSFRDHFLICLLLMVSDSLDGMHYWSPWKFH